MAEETKPCVACAEEIKAKAVLCKHCKTRQDDEAFTSPIDIQEQEPKEKGTVSQVIMIAGGASVILLLLLWGVLAFAIPSSTEEEDESNQSAQAAVSSEPAPVPAGKLTEIGLLEIGDCLNDSHTSRSEPSDSVFAVSCGSIHESQVFASTEVARESNWDIEQSRREARKFCADSFVEIFAGEPPPPRFDWRAHFSDEERWEESRSVDYVCVLSSSSGKTVGQLDIAGTDKPQESVASGDTNNGASRTNTGGDQPSSSAPNPVDEVEQQRQQLQRELDQQNAALEAQRRADAIADYESKMSFYISQVAELESRAAQLYAERDAAYAGFASQYGVSYDPNSNANCNNAADFFGCVNAHASMPRYDFSIQQAANDINFYLNLINSLVYPN